MLDSSANGSDASALCGIEWVATVGKALGVRVANLSAGTFGGDDGHCGLTNADPVHLAICHATAAGALFVVAAGNDGGAITLTIPASYDELLTATWMTDYGGSPAAGGTVVMSGSSMAAPHVAGTVALGIDAGACRGTPAELMARVRADAAARPSSYGFDGDPFRPIVAGQRDHPALRLPRLRRRLLSQMTADHVWHTASDARGLGARPGTRGW